MKIKEFGRDSEVAVLTMYWEKGLSKNQRIYMVVPYDGYEVLFTVGEDDCELTDPSIDGYRLVRSASNEDVIVLAIISDRDLLDRMIDHEPAAMAEFYEAATAHISTYRSLRISTVR